MLFFFTLRKEKATPKVYDNKKSGMKPFQILTSHPKHRDFPALPTLWRVTVNIVAGRHIQRGIQCRGRAALRSQALESSGSWRLAPSPSLDNKSGVGVAHITRHHGNARALSLWSTQLQHHQHEHALSTRVRTYPGSRSRATLAPGDAGEPSRAEPARGEHRETRNTSAPGGLSGNTESLTLPAARCCQPCLSRPPASPPPLRRDRSRDGPGCQQQWWGVRWGGSGGGTGEEARDGGGGRVREFQCPSTPYTVRHVDIQTGKKKTKGNS